MKLNAYSMVKLDTFHEYVEIYLQGKSKDWQFQKIPEKLIGEITLQDIYDYYKPDYGEMIYVIHDGGLSGKIYRCGNYEVGNWQLYAKTEGYA